MNYKFCILAAGKGTRNKAVEGLHKALLPLENKAAISRIIEKTPKDVEIIIAVGFKSDQIKSYLNKTHSDRKITYVDIENYDGIGSGPGLSLLSCKEHLQSPFIFTSVDTITEEDYFFNLKNNWIGISKIDKDKSEQYCLVDGDIYLNKFYYGLGDKCFIGIAGIYDYEVFWNSLNDKKIIKNEHQVLNGFNNLERIELKFFKWYDIGNNDSYCFTKKVFSNNIVAEKDNEVIFIEDASVIKYFSNNKTVENRIERVKYLNKTCPIVERIHDNMYYYKFINGKLLSTINDDNILKKIIPFWFDNLGNRNFEKNEQFINNCKKMYYEKTISRCEYFSKTDIDKIEYVNGIRVDSIENMLKSINWDDIYKNSIPSLFHGDFQPENIIYYDNSFVLIDWREAFGNSLQIGDFYYDLGKMYHSLLINGTDVNNKLYKISIEDNRAYIFHYIRQNLLFLLNELEKFCSNNNYSWENVKLLGILQYLNICSLYKNFHNGEYGKFLFLYGKYLLSKHK